MESRFNADDYYVRLGVPRDASASEIRRAFLRLAKEWHPDVNKSPGAEDVFKKVSEAYTVLSDSNDRQGYDQFSHQASSQSGQGARQTGEKARHQRAWEEVYRQRTYGRTGEQRRHQQAWARAASDAKSAGSSYAADSTTTSASKVINRAIWTRWIIGIAVLIVVLAIAAVIGSSDVASATVSSDNRWLTLEINTEKTPADVVSIVEANSCDSRLGRTVYVGVDCPEVMEVVGRWENVDGKLQMRANIQRLPPGNYEAVFWEHTGAELTELTKRDFSVKR